MNIISFIGTNVFLFSSWYLFLYERKKLISFADRIIGTFVFGLGQIIATEILLGVVLQKLFAGPLLMINMALSSLVAGAAVLRLLRLARRDTSYSLGSLVTEMKDNIADFFSVIRADLILFCIFSLTAISLCWMIFIGCLFPSYTWDALWYHLPIVGYMIQDGAIHEIPNHSFIHQFINIFPKNIELYFLWNIIFLRSDIIADLSQLPFTIIGMLTVYSIARKLEAPREYALYSSLLFFFTPIVILQSTTNYVDVAISVLFLVTVNFLVSDGRGGYPGEANEHNQRSRKSNLLLAGVSAGILLGAKGSGPLFIVILSSGIIIQKIGRRFGPLKREGFGFRRGVAAYLFYFLVPAVIIGGYWYMKNWVIYDNPVYPMEISFLGKTVFRGLYSGIIEPAPEVINRLSYVTRPLYVWTERIKYYLYDSRLGGLGVLWFVIFLPGIVFSLIHAVRSRRYRYITVFAIIVSAFLLYPRNWTPRYVIFLVGFGAISYGFLLAQFTGRKHLLRAFTLLLTVYAFFTADSPCVTPDQVRQFISLPARERTIARHKPFNIDLQARQEYGYWIWLSDHISGGDTLAYTFDPLFLSPLWNSSFTSRIAYVKGESYKEWIKNLEEQRATYILLRTNSREDQWIEKERGIRKSLWWTGVVQERFRIVYQDENYRIAKMGQVRG